MGINRKEELEKLVFKENSGNDVKAGKLIEEIIYIEDELETLRKLPKIKVHPKKPELQKPTPAAKLYKEYFQQYINALKLLLSIAGDLGESEEVSPLRKWVKNREEFYAD